MLLSNILQLAINSLTASEKARVKVFLHKCYSFKRLEVGYILVAKLYVLYPHNITV